MPAPRDCRSDCPIAYALDVVGDRWTLLVLRDLLFGGKLRFTELLSSRERIATNVLTDRLRRLEEAGLVVREPDPDDGRRALYRPTEAGLGLAPLLIEMVLWGVDHRGTGEKGPPAGLIARMRADREGLLSELRARHLG
jgi:DNA-binding HxlR family transcriptional regulator